MPSIQDLIRISVGTEHIDDIIADFEQSFKASDAATAEASAKGDALPIVEKTDEAPLAP